MVKVDHIPVFLGGDHNRPVGWGSISEGGVLNVSIQGGQLVKEIENLAVTSDIFGLHLGVNYRPAVPSVHVEPEKQMLDELAEVVSELNRSIAQIKRDHPEEPYRAVYRDGRYILAELLSAKAQALAAAAYLTE